MKPTNSFVGSSFFSDLILFNNILYFYHVPHSRLTFILSTFRFATIFVEFIQKAKKT
jgi:hypothetical protein